MTNMDTVFTLHAASSKATEQAKEAATGRSCHGMDSQIA